MITIWALRLSVPELVNSYIVPCPTSAVTGTRRRRRLDVVQILVGSVSDVNGRSILGTDFSGSALFASGVYLSLSVPRLPSSQAVK